MVAEIVTGRLRLRPATAADTDAFHAVVCDFDVVRRMTRWPWPPDRSFTVARAAATADWTQGPDGLLWAAGDVVGWASVARGRLGCMLARAAWGQGDASEIGAALIAHARDRFDRSGIDARVFADNRASIRVLEKLGFRPNREERVTLPARGAEIALKTMVLTRDLWTARGGD